MHSGARFGQGPPWLCYWKCSIWLGTVLRGVPVRQTVKAENQTSESCGKNCLGLLSWMINRPRLRVSEEESSWQFGKDRNGSFLNLSVKDSEKSKFYKRTLRTVTIDQPNKHKKCSEAKTKQNTKPQLWHKMNHTKHAPHFWLFKNHSGT